MRSYKRHSKELEMLVFNFRKAIETAKANNEPGELFRKFPAGQCGNTCDILAQYLIDNRINSITYTNGAVLAKKNF